MFDFYFVRARSSTKTYKFLLVLLLDIISKFRDISIAIFFREVVIKSNICVRLLVLD